MSCLPPSGWDLKSNCHGVLWVDRGQETNPSTDTEVDTMQQTEPGPWGNFWLPTPGICTGGEERVSAGSSEPRQRTREHTTLRKPRERHSGRWHQVKSSEGTRALYQQGSPEQRDQQYVYICAFISTSASRKRFIIRYWLTRLWKLRSPTICRLQAGVPGKRVL